MVSDLYLKSLEIQGFKSFPEKTRLIFEKPVTGIVGPNGSGKSNISDAILWVMGEQSTRMLRGGKMEDVIFGGTQRRSQVGYAEVSLILDNSSGKFGLEHNEIMLTRRYYRSGESEYYINKSLVRLKDLSEMLMDTGLGREGYSIIGQGRIAEILSTKSKDRREIFEEAAGISRYRHRKEEAERKLTQTEENLIRIGDKISELELQIDPLREQAETARKYLLLRDELRSLEIAVWLRELETLRVRAEKAESDHAAALAARDAVSVMLNDIYTKQDSLADKVRECDIETESVHNLISDAEAIQSETDSAIAVLKSRLEGNTGQMDSINKDIETQDGRQDGVGVQISERENRLSEISADKNKLESRTAELDRQLEHISGSAGESSDEIGSLLKNENERNICLSDMKAELSALASQAQELYDAENSVKQELAQAGESFVTLTAELDKSSEELKAVRESAVSLGNIVDGMLLKVQNRRKKAETAGEKSDRLSIEHRTLESRRNMLAEMEKDYQGYSKAVKLVMQEKARGTLKNVHGTAAELLKTGDRYTAAIETALGGALQHIIVDAEEDGKTAINLLKRRDSGRATFLPLSTIKGGALSESDFDGESGFEGIALGLVEYDKKYEGIYSYLLGRVVVSDNLNNAIRIAANHGHKYKIVTLDGQVMNAGGSMTGGSAVGNAGVLTRANELNLLNERTVVIANDLAKANREYAECTRELTAAEYELETAKAELRSEEDRLIRLESDHTHRTSLLEAAGEAITSIEAGLDALNNRIRGNGEETDSIRTRISVSETEAGALREKIEEAIRGREILTEERDRINAALSELRAQAAALDAEKDALAKTVLELTAMRDEISGSRERQLEKLDDLKNSNDEIRAEILVKEQASVTAQAGVDKYKKRLAEISAKKLEIEAKRSSINRELQDKNNEAMDIERECSRLEQRKLAAGLEEKQIVDKLWDNYELSRSAAKNSVSPIDSLAEAQRRISSLKKEMSELGVPNIGAIDEFDRVNKRYEFLTTQRADVEKAKSDITSIINDITGQMSEIFIREFEVINESFGRTFKELFGGGRATLELEDPDDVLDCGVEIHVQPPGKQLKTLTLLSGGEKAFVAIAIYFAILTVRPPPFVVMDEIEAALDDANVLRFAEYLRRMSNTTQMIVITHKRATMEETDVLYGVTMQELGVSSILSIDLDEAEKHIKG